MIALSPAGGTSNGDDHPCDRQPPPRPPLSFRRCSSSSAPSIAFPPPEAFFFRFPFFSLSQDRSNARVKLRLPRPEQGLGLHILSTLRQTWYVSSQSLPHSAPINPLISPHRPALDTNSPLPLFNSLTHLAYLTSTSPRIREIMTMDGGLERLVHILHDYCISPTPPENPAFIYGLSPPNSHPPKPTPCLNPKSFDKQAAYRFSLAFQCVVNIGVRGSEPIRSRVVQAGTLDVVGCILEAWLASKGFAIGPSSSASGMPRETREQRLARRQAQAEQRQRDQAAQLSRALQRQIVNDDFSRYDRSTPAVIDTYVAQVSPRSTPNHSTHHYSSPHLLRTNP